MGGSSGLEQPRLVEEMRIMTCSEPLLPAWLMGMVR